MRAAHLDSVLAEPSLYGPLVGVHAFGDLPSLPIELEQIYYRLHHSDLAEAG